MPYIVYCPNRYRNITQFNRAVVIPQQAFSTGVIPLYRCYSWVILWIKWKCYDLMNNIVYSYCEWSYKLLHYEAIVILTQMWKQCQIFLHLNVLCCLEMFQCFQFFITEIRWFIRHPTILSSITLAKIDGVWHTLEMLCVLRVITYATRSHVGLCSFVWSCQSWTKDTTHNFY